MTQELALRPYQEEAIRAVQAHWADGHPNVLGTAATGAGKTMVFLELLNRQMREHGGRGLILAHRKELVEQPLERLGQYWPEVRAGIVMAERDDATGTWWWPRSDPDSRRRLRQLPPTAYPVAHYR